VPITRRTTSAHDRLVALSGGARSAGVAGPGDLARGWVPSPPTPPGVPDPGAALERPGRVVLPFVRADRGNAPVVGPGDHDPVHHGADDHAAVGPGGAPPDDARPSSPGPGHGRHRAPAPAAGLVPATLSGGRWRVSRRAAAGTLLALVVLAGVLALRAGLPGHEATVVPARSGADLAPVPTSAAAAPVPTTGGEPTAPAAGAPSGQLVVHVVGQVLAPGLVRLAPGARVADAVEAAGGATPAADLSRVNLAKAVVDGEQVVLPLPGEPLPAGSAAGAGGGAGASGTGPAAGSPVDLNTADLAALDGLPGIGPVLAQRILDWRTENGRFTSVDELGEVTGIGDKLLTQLRDAVTV